MEDFLRRVVGLHWADRAYRAVVWVPDGLDVVSTERMALRLGYIEPVLFEAGGIVAKITPVGLERIGERFTWRRAA